MKKDQSKIATLLICAFLLLSNINFISQEFAPVGAKWYFNHSNPYNGSLMTKIECIATEEINGEECKVLETTEYIIGGPEDRLDSVIRSTDYYYRENNKIYHYDVFTEDFYAFYNFNIIPGDTIVVRDTVFDGCDHWNLYPYWYYCSNFSYAVDSSDSIDISGYSLKRFHTHSCWDVFGDEDWFFSHYSNRTPIIENIGSENFWFGRWNVFRSMSVPSMLRCYKDENMFYRSPDWPEPYPCDSIPQVYYTSINTTSSTSTMKIHPNPVKSSFSVTLNDYEEGTELRMYNSCGQIVRVRNIIKWANQYNFDVNNLTGGLYVILLLNNGAIVEKQKLVIED